LNNCEASKAKRYQQGSRVRSHLSSTAIQGGRPMTTKQDKDSIYLSMMSGIWMLTALSGFRSSERMDYPNPGIPHWFVDSAADIH